MRNQTYSQFQTATCPRKKRYRRRPPTHPHGPTQSYPRRSSSSPCRHCFRSESKYPHPASSNHRCCSLPDCRKKSHRVRLYPTRLRNRYRQFSMRNPRCSQLQTAARPRRKQYHPRRPARLCGPNQACRSLWLSFRCMCCFRLASEAPRLSWSIHRYWSHRCSRSTFPNCLQSPKQPLCLNSW